MSNKKKSPAEQTMDLGIAVAGLGFGIALLLFVGALLAIPVMIGGSIYLGYVFYRNSQNTPEKQRERLAATAALLHEEAKARCARTIDKLEFGKMVARQFPDTVPVVLRRAAIDAMLDIYDLEEFDRTIPAPPLIANEIDAGRYADTLAKVTALGDAELRIAVDTLARAFNRLFAQLPTIMDGEGPIEVPSFSYFPDIPEAIERVTSPFLREGPDRLFPRMNAIFQRNFELAKSVPPTKYKGDDVLTVFLQDTYLKEMFFVPIPITVPKDITYEHTIITAGTGQGKTTLLGNLILRDIKDPERPSIVVVDSQQGLIEKLVRLADVQNRRLIVISPKDAPALNVFDLNAQRISGYDAVAKEQILNHTLETFRYLFDALLGADLTTKQGTVFNYIVMLMLAMPRTMGRNATLLDLIQLTENPALYAPAMAALDPIARNFLQGDFTQRQFAQTREQIRYRLHAILGNPTLARLFLAPTNTIDFYKEMSEGAIILVNTDKAFLGAQNSAYLGRIAITFVLQAILERGANPGVPHKPVHVYIDEAGEYFDRSIDTFLTEARKHKAAMILAHQYLGQFPSAELRASVASNTSTKYAGGVSAGDARALATDMHTTAPYIMNVPKLWFACHIRNVLPEAISVPVTVGDLEQEEQVSEATYQAFREANRLRLAAPPPPDIFGITDDAEEPEDEPAPVAPPPRARKATAKKEADPHAPVSW